MFYVASSNSTEIKNVNNCVNKGEIKVYNSNDSSTPNIAGIATRSRNITNSYNIGKIIAIEGGTREYEIGGIATEGKVLNCYNLGEIVTQNSFKSSNRVGGISTDLRAAVKNCYNLGNLDIGSSDDVGGIIGTVQSEEVSLENCYNKGNTTTGGIIGWDYKGINEKIKNCFYQIGVAEYAIRYNYETKISSFNIEGQAMPLEASEMPSVLEVVSTGNEKVEWNGEMVDIWKEDTNNINNGYPILFWQ